MTIESRVYLQAELNGNTYGSWVNMDTLIDQVGDLNASLSVAMGMDPEFDEVLAFDSEGVCSAFIGRYGSFDTDACIEFYEWAAGEDDSLVNAALAYMDYTGNDWDKVAFEDAYNGEWDSERAFAENLFDDCYSHEVPEFMQNYIDYDAFARDLFCGDYTFIEGFVFSDC